MTLLFRRNGCVGLAFNWNNTSNEKTTRHGAVIYQFRSVAAHGQSFWTGLGVRRGSSGRTTQAAAATVDAVREHPLATLAIVAGVAFAIGALWKIGSSRRETTMGSLLSRVGELQDQLPRRWRTWDRDQESHVGKHPRAEPFL